LIEKLGQNYRFSKTPRSYRNLILGEAWNNFDGKKWKKINVSQNTMLSKNSCPRCRLEQF
jgi:hypothetical protein